MCHVKIMYRCISVTASFFLSLEEEALKKLEKISLVAFCFAVDYRICLYSNATETLTKTEFCVLLYKYSWTEFKSVSSETAEAPQKNKQRNIKLTVSISFVVVLQYSFQ